MVCNRASHLLKQHERQSACFLHCRLPRGRHFASCLPAFLKGQIAACARPSLLDEKLSVTRTFFVPSASHCSANQPYAVLLSGRFSCYDSFAIRTQFCPVSVLLLTASSKKYILDVSLVEEVCRNLEHFSCQRGPSRLFVNRAQLEIIRDGISFTFSNLLLSWYVHSASFIYTIGPPAALTLLLLRPHDTLVQSDLPPLILVYSCVSHYLLPP